MLIFVNHDSIYTALMRIDFVIWALSLLCFAGCNRHPQGHNDENNAATNDSLPTNVTIHADSLSTSNQAPEFQADTLACNDTVNVTHTPSAKELDELQNLISSRLQQLKGNPLQQNVWCIAVLPDAVEVSLAINTPYWRDEFRRYISDSPYILFDGPSKPAPISELVDSVVELQTVTLQPDSSSFSVNSGVAAFTLTNDSERDIEFGIRYLIGFKGSDGIWYKLPHPGIWEDMGIIIKPTGKYTIMAALNPKLNRNKPGTYRLYKQIQFADKQAPVWLMTEFRLE